MRKKKAMKKVGVNTPSIPYSSDAIPPHSISPLDPDPALKHGSGSSYLNISAKGRNFFLSSAKFSRKKIILSMFFPIHHYMNRIRYKWLRILN
jgi:hypothetical protein